jgi:hypothetical protein
VHHEPRKERAATIPTATPTRLSLRQASALLGKDSRFVRGFAECMGIELEESSTSLLMSHADFERLRRRIENPSPCADMATATR